MKTILADILIVGSELLHGGRIDRNSVFIGETLAQCGITLRQKTVVGDSREAIQRAIVYSLKTVDVIIVTGGLGSTLDDCTREAVAQTLGRPLRLRKHAWLEVQRQMQRRGRKMTPIMARQARIPKGAKVLANAVGTAPGIYLQTERVHVFMLPGVSEEAKVMMEGPIAQHLQKIYASSPLLWVHHFNTFGLPETKIQQLLTPLLPFLSAWNLSFLPSPLGVKVSVSKWLERVPVGPVHKDVNQRILAIEEEKAFFLKKMRKVLRPCLFSEGDQEMEEVVGNLLLSRKWKIALAESCTGGLLTNRLTDVPGSSGYVDRGCITYSNTAKQELLGVSGALLRRFGAVSAPVAQAMAAGIKTQSGVEVGVGITGVAGPGGGTPKKPVGLVYMAIDGPRKRQVFKKQFWGNRTEIKLRASQAALDMIRRYVVHEGK